MNNPNNFQRGPFPRNRFGNNQPNGRNNYAQQNYHQPVYNQHAAHHQNYAQPAYNQSAYNQQSYHQPAHVPPGGVFKICTYPRTTPDSVISVSHTPGENDVVYSNRFGTITLGKSIGNGGEGSVFETNTRFVVKIYDPSKNTAHKYEKIRLFMRHPLKCQGICAPVDIVYNESGEPVGYIMEKAEGIPLTHLFLPGGISRSFPGWKKRHIVELSVTMLKMFNFLHNRNVIVGDVSPTNILVKSSTEVYFVDVDSYQVEDLPCTVGRPEFTPPELL